MSGHTVESFEGSPAERYERYFVPAIGAPMANDIIRTAELQPGQSVLDVACGTGVVTRLAAECVGEYGSVAGVDIDQGMLEVARSVTPSRMSIDWYESNAEAMPLPDNAFDVALCQMGLQFIPNKIAALSEMRRVLVNGGRAILTTPGPIPQMFEILEDAIARHLDKQTAPFVGLVFSLHDAEEIEELIRRADFSEIDVQSETKSLHLPSPTDFLWQYVNSTPIAKAVTDANAAKREAFGRDVCERWQAFVQDGTLKLDLNMVTASARK